MSTTATTTNPKMSAAKQAYWSEPLNRYLQGERMREFMKTRYHPFKGEALRKRASERMSGSRNPSARLWHIIDPEGTHYRNVTSLKRFCREHDLLYHSFWCNAKRDVPVRWGTNKGWRLLYEENSPHGDVT